MKIDNLKARILILAKKHDMRLSDVAREAGYSKQGLNNLFYRKDASEYDLYRIADVFGVKKEDLLAPVTPEEFGVKTAEPLDRVRENLRMIAAEFGLTFSDIIKGAGLTEPVFRKAFRRNNPRMDVVEKISEFVGIDPDELFEKIDYERYGKALVPKND